MSTAPAPPAPTPSESRLKDLLGALKRFLDRAATLTVSTPAPKEAEMLVEVDDNRLSQLMTRKPVVIDLISYLYPNRELDYKDLWHILRESYRGFDENLFVFRADRKLADKFRTQLSSFLKEMQATNALPRPEKLRCFFKVDPDVDQAALRSQLAKTVGTGMVTDDDMKYVTQAWDDPDDH